MILIEAGERGDKAFDAKLLFAGQLAQRGHPVVLDDLTRPERLDRHQKYEAAHLMADAGGLALSRVIVIGAETIAQETLVALRARAAGRDIPVAVLGRFPHRQAAIAAQSKVAYAIGREPQLVDLAALQGPPLLQSALAPQAAADPMPETAEPGLPQVLVCLPTEALDDPQTLPILSAMDNLPGYRLGVILPGKGKEQLRASRHGGIAAYGYTELSPSGFAGLASIAAYFGEGVPGERMAAMALDLMRAGRVVVDCTVGGGFAAAGAPALRGPADLAGFANYLQHTVLTNRAEIGRQTRASPWLATRTVEALEAALDLPARGGGQRVGAGARRTVFMPTNGIGLGHARRCALVAEAMRAAGGAAPAFAAFPSCVPMLLDKGFDCLPLVQKSPDHPEEFANDIINYLRLRRLVRRGDRLVFDGGHVFDSVYRTVLESGLDAIWIRRGLLQPGQAAVGAGRRERAFRRVIVPGEAFDELNTPRQIAPHVTQVGPIVQTGPVPDDAARAAGRAALGARLGHPARSVVVTMLGGGVAADRTAQLQALATMTERRPGCLHLVVVWPGSVVPPGLQSWKNTRVVQTRNALGLALLADFTVSATGYNSFHELLYHGIPTIFVPQMASFMDDQERRARAASERGLARTVLAHEALLLEREMTAFLDGGRAAELGRALAAAALPPPGNAEAAALIAAEEGR